MDFDYKTYSLSKLEDWVCDAISTGEATPQEIYDTIKNVVQEQYDYYKNGAEKTNELLSLLNGHNDQIQFNFDTSDYINFDTMCGIDNTSDYCNTSWNSFWGDDVIKEYQGSTVSSVNQDKVTKWRLPVEVDAASDDYYVQFPDDLLEAANLKEGDKVEWVDNGNGSYLLRKI
jgi:hypothetical protein